MKATLTQFKDRAFVITKYLTKEFYAVVAGISIATLGGYWGSNLNYFHVKQLENTREIAYESQRAKLHGLWLLKLFVEQSEGDQYNNLSIYHLMSLSVDKAFQVEGVAYKWKEINHMGGVLTYSRTSRSKSSVSGSIIGNRVLLNLQTQNSAGLESINVIEGTMGEKNGLTGSFASDVALQKGIFCATRVAIPELSNSALDCPLN